MTDCSFVASKRASRGIQLIYFSQICSVSKFFHDVCYCSYGNWVNPTSWKCFSFVIFEKILIKYYYLKQLLVIISYRKFENFLSHVIDPNLLFLLCFDVSSFNTTTTEQENTKCFSFLDIKLWNKIKIIQKLKKKFYLNLQQKMCNF